MVEYTRNIQRQTLNNITVRRPHITRIIHDCKNTLTIINNKIRFYVGNDEFAVEAEANIDR